ncbi:hypothetical protein J4221_06930 [Candidatus Pacearchaeota archaeon]|nr:hypothetical protein [Candidatus Pacearchaeota archaeon]
MRPTRVRRDKEGREISIVYHPLDREQILRLESLLYEGGFIISDFGHVYPQEIFDSYKKSRYVPKYYPTTNIGVPAPVGFLRRNNGESSFGIHLDIKSLHPFTRTVRRICEKI